MSSSLEIADISKSLNAMQSMASKLININSLISSSVKKIEKKVDDIEKQSLQNLKKIADKIYNIKNVIEVNVNNSINIENVIDNNISINTDGDNSKPNEGNKSYSLFDDFIIKIKSLIENFSLFTLNFNPNVNINANATFYAEINANISLIANLISNINIRLISIFISMNILVNRVSFLVTLFTLQTSIIIGQLSTLIGLLLAGGSGVAPEKEKKSGWRILTDFLSDLNTIFTFIDNVRKWIRLLNRSSAVANIISKIGTAFRLLGRGVMGFGSILRVAVSFLGRALMLLLSPVGVVIAAIIAICTLLYIFRDEVKAAISLFVNYVINIFKIIWSYVVDAFNWVKAVIINVWDNLVNFISNSINNIIGFFSGLWDAINFGINLVILFFSALWDGLIEGIQNGINIAILVFSYLWNGIVEGVNKAITFFANLWNSISNSIGNIKDNIVGFFKGLWASIVSNIKDMLPDWLGDKLFGESESTNPEEVAKSFEEINENLRRAIENQNVSPESVASVSESHYAVSQSSNIVINIQRADEVGIQKVREVVSSQHNYQRILVQEVNGGAS